MQKLIIPFLLCILVSTAQAQNEKSDIDKMHLEALKYPTAFECAKCHPDHFEQWAVSPHAYGQLSPVFNSMQAAVTKLTNGTNGDFCIRCHTNPGMALEEPTFTSNLNRAQISREGVTCITCHRINQAYGKISGRLSMDTGDIYAKVYGPEGGEELKRTQKDPDLKLATPNEKERRRPVHLEAEKFFQMPTSGFCGACHDVTLLNGFRLEEAFSEYKSSPAAKRGVSCQDCHMGKTQGVFTGDPKTNYAYGPAAIIEGKKDRRS